MRLGKTEVLHPTAFNDRKRKQDQNQQQKMHQILQKIDTRI